MARSSSLDSVIETIFQGSNSHSVIDRWRSRETSAPITPKMYIEIPIDADSFEFTSVHNVCYLRLITI